MEDESIKINEGHYLELMDRLHVVGSNFENNILNHPLTETLDDKEFQEHLHKALSHIYDAYQKVGQLDYEHNYNEEDVE